MPLSLREGRLASGAKAIPTDWDDSGIDLMLRLRSDRSIDPDLQRQASVLPAWTQNSHFDTHSKLLYATNNAPVQMAVGGGVAGGNLTGTRKEGVCHSYIAGRGDHQFRFSFFERVPVMGVDASSLRSQPGDQACGGVKRPSILAVPVEANESLCLLKLQDIDTTIVATSAHLLSHERSVGQSHRRHGLTLSRRLWKANFSRRSWARVGTANTSSRAYWCRFYVTA